MNRSNKQKVGLGMLSFLLLMLNSSLAGQIIYVDASATGANDGSSWTDAYVELQSALVEAEYGDEIRVAAGTYKPDYDPDSGTHTGDREATFQLVNGVAIYGGFPTGGGAWEERDPNTYFSILSGDLNDNDVGDPYDPSKNDNCYHVVTSSGTNETAVLDGFTITAGKAYGYDNNGHGGGMYNFSGSPTLKWCHFIRNWSASHGGGIYNVSGSPTLINCTFTENTSGFKGGAGIYNVFGNPMLTDCTFCRNWAIYGSGGGMYNDSGNSTLINCVFAGNKKGSQFGYSAYGGGGGMYNNNSSPMLINCTFSGNLTFNDKGGGMRNFESSSPTLVNCTLSGNSSNNNYGGGIYNDDGSPTLINCILWGNRDIEGVDESAQIHGGTPTISYSCIQGLETITDNGNIGDDPQFMESDGPDGVIGTEDDNLRLWPGSACADAGDNLAVPTSVITDLDGDPRITNGIVDMGAYEGPKQGFLLSTDSIIVPEGGTTTFTVALAIDPAESIEVTVGRRSGDLDITVEFGGALTFDSSNFSVPQIVTLAATEDLDTITGSALILVSAPGLVPFGVTAIEGENEPYPNVLVVDAKAPGANNGSSWTDAFIDLQEALGFAAMNPEIVEIRVAQGVYRPVEPNGDRTVAFQLLDGVVVKGGYAGYGQADPDARDIETYKTILSGDLNGNDGPNFTNNGENSFHVVTGYQTESMDKTTEVLDGFAITGGNANASSSPDNRGGGMYCNSEATVRNCTFTENFAAYGGGMYCGPGRGCVTYPIITNCTFIGNSAGNEGGGMWIGDSDPKLSNCIISGNSAGSNGGGIMFGGDNFTTMVNCLINGNSAGEYGGGIYGVFCFGWTMTNCTVTENLAGVEGGGIYNQDGSYMTLTNCILWGDYPEEISGEWIDWVTVNHCCIQGGWPGEGNIDADPCFVQPMYLDPISYWKFDEGSGTAAYDSTGSYHGTIYGDTAWVPGQVGWALCFGDRNDYVRVEHDPSLNMTGDLTISAWLYITRGGKYQAIVTKCEGNGGWNNPFDFRTNYGAEPQLAFVRADTVAHERVYSKVKMPLHQWHHVLVRVENNVPDFYVNGILAGKYADTIFTRTPTGNTNPLQIGRRDDGLYFNGMIDEVMIFDRALSPEEIHALYHNDFSLLGDYHLRPDSPCIDAGADAGIYIDLEGNLRPFDYPGVDNNGALTEFDMGAYEFVAAEAEMKVTPRTINCRSHGKWVKAHLYLPEGFGVSDVDENTPARMEPLGIESDHLQVSAGEDGLVKIKARFKRSEFCAAFGGDWPDEIIVFGSFTNGEFFYGKAGIRVITPGLKDIVELSSYWLEEGCKKPHWCDGMDINQDSVVDLRDFVLLQNSCIEFENSQENPGFPRPRE